MKKASNSKFSQIGFWNRLKGVERNKIDKKTMKLAQVKTTITAAKVGATFQALINEPRPSSISPNWTIPVWPDYISISLYNSSKVLLSTWTMSVDISQKDVHFWKDEATMAVPGDPNKIDKHTDYIVTISADDKVTFSEAKI